MARTEKRRLSDLLVDEENPHAAKPKNRAALAASIRTFGYVDLIVVNGRTNRVVGGHKRLQCLLEAGVEEADVVVGDWTDAEARALAPALSELSLADFTELRLDGLLKQTNSAPVSAQEVGPVADEFWISMRGPLPSQPDALEALKMALKAIAGVTVEIGILKR